MNKKYKGGVLLTALLFVFLFSFIFTLVLEDFQLTHRFTKKTKDYYIAKTMVSMFLSDIKQEKQQLVKKGYQNFSIGTLQYEYDQATISIVVQLNQTTYSFQEQYKEVKKNQIKTNIVAD
ncbi:competence type IV pilus minor pilin ComGG [Enterococcus ureasiticus]|uniref:Competence protein ComGG n=1 Tax=Enterococcus ureasiticus TaxID=903984 RepID=A0A1E5GF23_9ENTE|nr:competence type IV pilus minor pilin ComGG [Enterococcus ureasiticus]OEG11308.1 hypothetical protein BCR21_08380 [Enterococcus ureasiticus]